MTDLLHIQPVLSYMHMGRALIDTYGMKGEAAVREALRSFAVFRGGYLRKKHQALGMKTNLKNHFYYNTNPYSGASFTEKIFHVTEEEDVRECYSCPTMTSLIARNERFLAVTYCEETHPLLWQSYAPGAIVNLGKTLAMEGSDCCTFNVFLRPGRLTKEQRKECFEEYDPEFKGDRRNEFVYPTAFEGANLKAVFMVQAFYDAALKQFGEEGLIAVAKGLENFAKDITESIAKNAKEKLSMEVFYNTLMVNDDISKDGFWDELSNENVKNFAKEKLYKVLNEQCKQRIEENK